MLISKALKGWFTPVSRRKSSDTRIPFLDTKTVYYEHVDYSHIDNIVSWPSYHYNGNPSVREHDLHIGTSPRLLDCDAMVLMFNVNDGYKTLILRNILLNINHL